MDNVVLLPSVTVGFFSKSLMVFGVSWGVSVVVSVVLRTLWRR